MSGTTIRVAIHPPAPDETLSSVFDRAANFWGIDRASLLSAIAHDGESEDLDSPSPAMLDKLASMGGFARLSLALLVLEDSADLLQPECRVGYCPWCWEEDAGQQREPYFRRSWASTAALGCDRHGTLLYAWDVDSRGRRRLAPISTCPDSSDAMWKSDLAHAKTSSDAHILKPLFTLAAQANAALTGNTAWPASWRGCQKTGRALIGLLSTNPAPYPDRLAMDRLVPEEPPGTRWFASHRWCSNPTHADGIEPIRHINDPAIRRTLWWLFARTIASGWEPLQMRGCYGLSASVEMWWRQIGGAISGYGWERYRDIGDALGFSASER